MYLFHIKKVQNVYWEIEKLKKTKTPFKNRLHDLILWNNKDYKLFKENEILL